MKSQQNIRQSAQIAGEPESEFSKDKPLLAPITKSISTQEVIDRLSETAE